MNTLKGKKIELLPVQIFDEKTRKHCSNCDGIGWIEKDKGHIEKCPVCCGSGYLYLCSECGKEVESSYTAICKDCREKEWIERKKREEKFTLEQAEKLVFGINDDKIKEFNYFYSEDYPYDDGYFADFSDFVDALEGKYINKKNRPEYVWGTYEKIIEIDIDNAIGCACEELHEEAYDNISNKDYKELKDFVSNWCKKQTGTTTYYPDYRYAIKVPWGES